MDIHTFLSLRLGWYKVHDWAVHRVNQFDGTLILRETWYMCECVYGWVCVYKHLCRQVWICVREMKVSVCIHISDSEYTPVMPYRFSKQTTSRLGLYLSGFSGCCSHRCPRSDGLTSLCPFPFPPQVKIVSCVVNSYSLTFVFREKNTQTLRWN